MEESDDYILMIKTVQISPFRTLMVAMKDILLETNISFQKDGIRIVNMDKSQTVLVHMHLHADNFEYYECKKDKIIVGVNMIHLFKLISSNDCCKWSRELYQKQFSIICFLIFKLIIILVLRNTTYKEYYD